MKSAFSLGIPLTTSSASFVMAEEIVSSAVCGKSTVTKHKRKKPLLPSGNAPPSMLEFSLKVEALYK